MIASGLLITGFSARNGFVHGVFARLDICKVAMHGQAGAVNFARAAAAVFEIRRKLEGYSPGKTYIRDETGLLYRRLSSRSYMPRRDRNFARGTKTMRIKDRVKLVLCTNADGIHKLPVAISETASSPLRFLGDGNASPLPYFSQKLEWMDRHVFRDLCGSEFLPSVRERCGSGRVPLIMDNSATNEVILEADQFVVLSTCKHHHYFSADGCWDYCRFVETV